MASSQSEEDMELHEGSANYEPKHEGQESEHGADPKAQSEPPYVAPRAPSINCPSRRLAQFASSPYDPSPL